MQVRPLVLLFLGWFLLLQSRCMRWSCWNCLTRLCDCNAQIVFFQPILMASLTHKALAHEHFFFMQDTWNFHSQSILSLLSCCNSTYNLFFIGNLHDLLSPETLTHMAFLLRLLHMAYLLMQDQCIVHSRGFGFSTFDSEQPVEEIVSQRRMLEIVGK